MIDIHCHILPGVDDGARTIEEAQQMLHTAASCGVTDMVATPHVRQPDLDLTPIEESYQKLAPIARAAGVGLLQGYECNISALHPSHLEVAKRYCIQGTSMLLLEFPFDLWPPNWREIVYCLQALGLKVIVAHPERYLPIQRDPSLLGELMDLQCYFQINVSSLKKTGPRRNIVKKLKAEAAIHFVASDAHRVADYLPLVKAQKKLERIWRYQTTSQFLALAE